MKVANFFGAAVLDADEADSHRRGRQRTDRDILRAMTAQQLAGGFFHQRLEGFGSSLVAADHVGLARLAYFGELLAFAAQRRKPSQAKKHGADEMSPIHGIPFHMNSNMKMAVNAASAPRTAQPSVTVRSVTNPAELKSEADVARQHCCQANGLAAFRRRENEPPLRSVPERHRSRRSAGHKRGVIAIHRTRGGKGTKAHRAGIGQWAPTKKGDPGPPLTAIAGCHSSPAPC